MSQYDRDYFRPSGFGGFSFFPPIIKNLLVINIAVFFLQMIFDNISFGGIPGWYFINKYFALNPLTGLDQAGQPYNFQIWQLFTYQFLHGGFMHLFFNMFALWIFGVELENLFGSRKFLFYYLMCGVGAGLLHIFASPIFDSISAPTIGASGAVYGVLIAFGMLFPDRYVFLLFPPMPVKAKYLIAFYIVIEFMSVGSDNYVAHLAHLGGAFFGFVFILLDRRKNFDIDGMYRKVKDIFTSPSKDSSTSFRKPKRGFRTGTIEDAEFYEINSKKEQEVSQEVIDEILDKISKSGYQNLTEKEKRILFEASKKQ
ncbi:MAG: rhomboid family intramembrane serine protease [Ignavibacteriales bacterium]|jgi:membrane associated rhomboid family serine protease|nr:MAG: rhomboid family intramembrane serine protease [Ignavibacteriales bacterium]